jgi:radical SAM superfamily enzyme YgiQ (UPF0313 family)
MHIVLWDTRKLDVSKDFAGGFGVGQYPGYGGLRGKLIRHAFTRDWRPVGLLYAYLAAIFRRLGHTVEYVLDRTDVRADLYVFCPSLITLELEHQAIARVLEQAAPQRVLVVGTVASVMPEAFADLDVTVVKGEAEQLLWKLDEVLARPGASVQLGTIEDLDALPFPDWSLFEPWRFRIGYDFWKFPTALIQQSRGCAFHCNYCPYLVLEAGVRHRSPEAVVEEMRYGIQRWGFASFKFRDPLFGLDRSRVFRLVEQIERLPQKIQFSIETRVDLMRPEILRVLKRVGLTSITIGVETPDQTKLRAYHRATINDDRQRDFIALCRSMGIRTVAGFLIGFPGDTEQSIRDVEGYAKSLNPTFANFNIVTPYPGTEFYAESKDRLIGAPLEQYTVYRPVMRCDHLSPERLQHLHTKCFLHFYFRWKYLQANAHLLWPSLSRLGLGREVPRPPAVDSAHEGVPRPLSGEILRSGQQLRRDGPHEPPRTSDEPTDGKARRTKDE